MAQLVRVAGVALMPVAKKEQHGLVSHAVLGFIHHHRGFGPHLIQVVLGTQISLSPLSSVVQVSFRSDAGKAH